MISMECNDAKTCISTVLIKKVTYGIYSYALQFSNVHDTGEVVVLLNMDEIAINSSCTGIIDRLIAIYLFQTVS